MAMGSDGRKNKVYISLGSNLGDRKSNLSRAIELIGKKTGKVIEQSSIYETESWGNEELPTFYNMAIQIETKLTASELMDMLLKIESEMGRKRTANKKYTSRIVDIDIIYFNNEVISLNGLEIPHPHMHKRNFVLVPLVEIAAGFIHPILKKSNTNLLNISTDKLQCKRTI